MLPQNAVGESLDDLGVVAEVYGQRRLAESTTALIAVATEGSPAERIVSRMRAALSGRGTKPAGNAGAMNGRLTMGWRKIAASISDAR